jgi:pimeloyl-ACP methyl ester carboxylesterase
MEPMADTIPTAATGSRSTSVHHAFIRALLLSQTPEGYASLCNAIVSAARPDYSSINCPVLVISGEEDKTAGLSDSKEIMAR